MHCTARLFSPMRAGCLVKFMDIYKCKSNTFEHSEMQDHIL